MFDEYLDSEYSIVKGVAEALDMIKKDHDAGNLSKEEAEELSGDIIEMARLQTLAETVERKAAIEKAVDALSSLFHTKL